MFVRVQVPPAVLFRREDRGIEDAGRRPFLFVVVCNQFNPCSFCPYRAYVDIRSFSPGRCPGLGKGMPLQGGWVDCMWTLPSPVTMAVLGNQSMDGMPLQGGRVDCMWTFFAPVTMDVMPCVVW